MFFPSSAAKIKSRLDCEDNLLQCAVHTGNGVSGLPRGTRPLTPLWPLWPQSLNPVASPALADGVLCALSVSHQTLLAHLLVPLTLNPAVSSFIKHFIFFFSVCTCVQVWRPGEKLAVFLIVFLLFSLTQTLPELGARLCVFGGGIGCG